MIKEFKIVVFAVLFPFVLLGQSNKVDCQKVKEGTFYFYPSNTKLKYVIIRGDSIQEEIDYKTADTTFWKVYWQNDCTLKLGFIRKTQPISDGERYFYNSHITVIKIMDVTKDYYTFKGGLDSISTLKSISDTLWFNAR